MSAQAARRRRAAKADRYRAAQLAPQVRNAVMCRCGHARLLHAFGRLCRVENCGCEDFEAVNTVNKDGDP